jgi:hypothetical protein
MNKLNRKGYRTTTGKKFTPANLSLLGHQFFNTKERTDYKVQLPVEKEPSIDPVTVSNPERLYDLVWQAFTMEEKRKAVLSVVQ